MKRWTGVLGVLGLLFAIADLVHGQHNGDMHRVYLHRAEFVSLLGFVSLLEIQAFRLIRRESSLNGWLTGACVSFASLLLGIALFGLAGGSAHGDGGPIAAVCAITGFVGSIGLPVTLIGFLIARLIRSSQARTVSETTTEGDDLNSSHSA